MTDNNISSFLINRDFLINALNLRTSNSKSVFFEGDNMVVLSPSVQHERLTFDIQKNTMLNVVNSNKKAFLIIRFFKEFLVSDLKLIAEELLTEKNITTYKDGSQKWALRVNKDDYYSISVNGNRKKVKVEKLKAEELKDWVYKNTDDNFINIKMETKKLNSKQIIDVIHSYIIKKGFLYSKEEIKNFYLSLRSKPFVIISGISGTGKTKIVQLFAEAIGATESNGQFKLIPVRPDWSDSSDLLGYTDIKGDFKKGPFTEMVEKALKNPNLPHFVLLDEMNLARVEYYFSDVLSVMESRKVDEDGNYTSSPFPITYKDENGNEKTLTLPGNLYIIGTVNMDETTHTFSKKVLDRANTIEFNDIDLMNFNTFENNEQEIKTIPVSNDAIKSSYIFLKQIFKAHESLIREVSEKISKINKHLEPIYAQVGYRVRDEICFYMVHNEEAGKLLTENEAMDFCIMQKILPRISGTGTNIEDVLKELEKELKHYEKSSKKIEEMLARLRDNGFTSFWIA